MRFFYFYIFLFINHLSSAQTYQGIVKDSKTNEPIPNVTIYFANSSSGTISNIDGTFSVTRPEGLNATLIFRALSYEILNIDDFENTNLGTVILKPKVEKLSVVKIEGDPWGRSKKEKLFLEYFLGTSQYSNNIKIANLDKINLRFIPSELIMVATSDSPIVINHPELGYDIVYDLVEFQIDFEKTVSQPIKRGYNYNKEVIVYNPRRCLLKGFSYYQDLINKTNQKKKAIKTRNKLYKSSLLCLYKSIINNSLEENDFILKHDGDQVNSIDEIEFYKEGNLVYVEFDKNEYTLKDYKKNRSTIKLFGGELIFDEHYNNITPLRIIVSGYISTLGLGGQLPADYNHY